MPAWFKVWSRAAFEVVDGVVEIARIDEESRLAVRTAAVCRYWWWETGPLKAVGGKEAGLIQFAQALGGGFEEASLWFWPETRRKAPPDNPAFYRTV